MDRMDSFDRQITELEPVDIGTWVNYKPYANKEQLQLQKANLTELSLRNGPQELRFIYTEYLAGLNEQVEDLANRIPVVNTETMLECEVYYTATIEGAKTTRKRTSELHMGAPVDSRNQFSERMVKNGFDAVKLLNLYGNTLNETQLLQVWQVLTDGCRENEDIQGDRYRTGDVQVGTYLPPACEFLPEIMDTFFAFYNGSEMDEYPFLKAALIHYAFETIHPFCDGNGRLGRLLMNNYLIRAGIESARAVSFSEQINRSRSAYDAAFDKSENFMNDCTPFLTYMLEIMLESFYSVRITL